MALDLQDLVWIYLVLSCYIRYSDEDVNQLIHQILVYFPYIPQGQLGLVSKQSDLYFVKL